MSALFGFYGPSDAKLLERMQQALAHRGERPRVIETQQLSLGYWESSWTGKHCGAGLQRTETGTIGLAGFQTPGESKNQIGLDQIASRLSEKSTPPDELSGDFVIVFLVKDGRFYLVRDGSGARTVYFAEWEGRLFFASEPKAIWSLPGFPRRLAPNSLAKYLTYSFVPGEETMLKGIRELPAGHSLIRQPGGEISLQRYFRFEEVQEASSSLIPADDAVSAFRQAFSQSVTDRLTLLGDQPPVVFLSGGLDSSVVTAELVRQSTKKVRTYSLHFGEKYPNELAYARLVAERLGTEHEEVLIRPKDFVGNLHDMVWHLDDPIGDPITMPNFELAKRVGSEVDFVFNGEGGDPCFGGPKNIPMLLLHWYGTKRPPLFQEKAYLASYRRAYEELEYLFTPDFRKQIDDESLASQLTPFFECEHPRNYLDKLTAINIRLKGAHLILPKVERMLAATGRVPLSPLFSSELVRLSFQIPSVMKLRRGIEKVVIKEAYRDTLPQQIIDRPKSGMRVPVHFWFQGELRKYARKLLSPKEIKSAGIFDHRRVKQLLNYSIEEGNGRYGMRLWMLLTFEIWRHMVIENQDSR